MNLVPDILTRNLERPLPSDFLRLLFSDQEPQVFTYQDCFRRAAYFGRVFQQTAGADARGARVAILLDHSLDLYASFLGALLAGFVPSIFPPPSPKMAAADYLRILDHLVQDTVPALVLLDRRHAQLAANLRHTQTVVPETGAFEARPVALRPGIQPADTAFLQYSSGTTGRRKGVAISHQALLWQVENYANRLCLQPQDKFVSWLPLYHDMGLIACFLLPFLRGNALVAMSPFDWVKRPMLLLEAVDAYHPQWCWMPNFAFSFLAKAKSAGTQWDLGSLRGWINCSEPITAESIERFTAAFAGHGVRRETVLGCYAMAETVFAVTQQFPGAAGCRLAAIQGDSFAKGGPLKEAAPDERGARTFASSGTPMPETEIRIVDESGQSHTRELVLGEISVRSPGLFSGYDNAATVSSPLQHGHFLTGDLGFLMGGELFVAGRKKDLIIVQGKNILPHDVENAVGSVENIIPGRCVAFGVFDAGEGTERIVVVAETREANPAERLSLTEKIRRAVLLAADVPASDVLLVEPMWLLKSTSGKISRSKNREKYLETLSARPPILQPHRPPTPPTGPASDLRPRLEQIVRTQVPALAQADLDRVRLITDGWVDSLGVAEMITRIEKELDLTFDLREVADLQIFDSFASIVALAERRQARANTAVGHRIELRQLDEIRSIKTRIYRESARDFDLLVLGSSRCFVLHTETASQFGFKAFNFSVDAGRPEDFYCMLRLFLDQNQVKPRWIFMGLDLETISEQAPVEPSLYACPDLAKYLNLAPPQTPTAALNTRQDELWQVFRRGINETLEYGFAKGTGNIVWRDFRPDSPPMKIDDGNNRNAVYFRRMEGFSRLAPARLQVLDEFGRVCRAHGINWLAFLSTAHECLFQFLAANTSYLQRSEELAARIRQSPFPPAAYFDLSGAASFGGDPQDFMNGAHIAFHNGRLLFEFLLKQARQLELRKI